jgi:hypothetical protein
VKLLWYLLALAPFAAVFYIVWAYRKKTAAHAAASRERLAEVLKTPGQTSVIASSARALSPPPPPAASTAAGISGGAGPYVRHARLLSPHHIKVVELLEAGLPGHVIFAHVGLEAIVDVGGLPLAREREQRQRGLAQHTIDCVVCTPAFEVVAAIDLESSNMAEARFKGECLKAAGVRYLQWNPGALPASHEVAAVVGGI